jgi:hypothetical protein
MGGSTDKKEETSLIQSKLYSAGYKILDFLSKGALSKREARISGLEEDVSESEEKNTALANRIVVICNNQRKERVEWARRVGLREKEIEDLYFTLGERNKEIQGLEGKLAEAQGILTLAQNELSEVKDAYARVQAIVDANLELEGAMADFEKYYARWNIKGAEFGKNALNMIRRMKAFVRIAYEKAEEEKQKNALGRAYVKLEKKKAVLVLDEKRRIEAMSPVAEKMFGEDLTGKDVGYVSNWLGLTIGYVAPTYEEGFHVITSVGNLEDVRVDVDLERYDGQHIGSYVVVEPKSWFDRSARKQEAYTLVVQGTFDNGSELTKMVNAAVALDYRGKQIGMDLRAVTEISDNVARRIGGLAQSRYFRNKMKLVVTNLDVYAKLIRYDVPKELILDIPETGPAVKGIPAPVRLT